MMLGEQVLQRLLSRVRFAALDGLAAVNQLLDRELSLPAEAFSVKNKFEVPVLRDGWDVIGARSLRVEPPATEEQELGLLRYGIA